jgi:hypothetical protein
LKDICAKLGEKENCSNVILWINDKVASQEQLSQRIDKIPGLVMDSHILTFIPINYKTVVFCQTANGAWSDKVLRVLDLKSVEDLMQKQKDEEIKKLGADVILTLAAIKILKEKFSGNSKEWKLVVAKGAGYIKKHIQSPLEQLLQKLEITILF